MDDQVLNSRPLYRSFNLWYRIPFLLFKIGLLILLYTAIIHFKENPIVISILGVILIYLIVFVNTDKIIVFNNRVEFYDASGSRFRLYKKHVYYFNDIAKISISGFHSKTFEIITSIILRGHFSPHWNFVRIDFNDGYIESISTDLYKDELKKAVEIVNGELKNFKN